MAEAEQELEQLFEQSVALSEAMRLASDRKRRELRTLQGRYDDLLVGLKVAHALFGRIMDSAVPRSAFKLAQRGYDDSRMAIEKAQR